MRKKFSKSSLKSTPKALASPDYPIEDVQFIDNLELRNPVAKLLNTYDNKFCLFYIFLKEGVNVNGFFQEKKY